MPTFSPRSTFKLATCHPLLQQIMNEAIDEIDFAVICGHRNQADQDKAYAEKKSRLRWPDSRHNSLPSKAVDLFPYPYDWNDIEAFKGLAVVIKRIAEKHGVWVTWGGDWKMRDMPHFELR